MERIALDVFFFFHFFAQAQLDMCLCVDLERAEFSVASESVKEVNEQTFRLFLIA